ncbi:MAG: YtxH domain-containing protein [Nitrospiraceae bacterium]
MSTQGRQVAKVAALVAGSAALGAGLGLLFAPRTGNETRRTITRYAKRAQVQATRLGRAVKSTVAEAMERGKSIAQKRAEKPLLEATSLRTA